MKRITALILTLVVLAATAACTITIGAPEPTAAPIIEVVTATPQPTPILTPTMVPTAIPTPQPATLTVNVPSNCRSGPGTQYTILTGITPGQTVLIGGHNTDSSWLLVQANSVTTCWIASYLGTVNGDVLNAKSINAPTPVYAYPTRVPYRPWYPWHPYNWNWNVYVTLFNTTGNSICSLTIMKNGDSVWANSWKPGQFGNGAAVTATFRAGWYDIRAYSCKPGPHLISKLDGVDLTQNFSINLP